MKKILSFLAVWAFVCGVQAQVVYRDASAFPLLGKIPTKTLSRYERFPAEFEKVSRPNLWKLSRNSAGMAIRFRSNTTQVRIKWSSLYGNHHNHMTDVNVKGLDLYCLLEDGSWRFVNSARPTGKETDALVVANMQPKEREYMLYLSMYDGVESLAIGVDSLATLEQPKVDLPVRHKPVVLYGTSILQGGCANRPGMAHTNILSRRLNRECINLGFSGNAFLDMEVARLISEVDAGIFVLDFVPNASVEQMNERMEAFYRTIRGKHPATPIVFIEDPHFTHGLFDQNMAKEVADKNRTLNEIFARMKRNGEKNIYLIRSDKMLGNDGEGTVDGIHFTDLGMMRYADLVYPVLKKHINTK